MTCVVVSMSHGMCGGLVVSMSHDMCGGEHESWHAWW